MGKFDILNAAIVAKIPEAVIVPWRTPCRPKILMLVDGLNYTPTDGFGLWRFIHGITLAAGVTNKPVLTLAHRGLHPGPTVTVGADTYTVLNNFNFSTAATPVTLANYDQVWVFGIGGGAFSLSNAEVGVISEFMNGGGGYFATGDHAALGRALSGSLPRIRHMREWRDAPSGGVPMGTEVDVNMALNRIDTVVSPGSNQLYEFIDQSDNIPQRIYPNYKVTDTDGLAGTGWEARAHPLLMRPGAPVVRSSANAGGANLNFTQDIDVLPDHPHESVCYEVTSAPVLGGNYNISGQNFAEYQPNAAVPAQRVAPEIVAFAVSGGRTVLNGVWKPPVKPRMFGVISAYDGRIAQAYPGKTQRPGRIVCDSTWHHYVNVNLDGTTSGRTGLGTGSGAGFVPSPDLEKIYSYYRNIVSWLQPANRVWCSIFWDLAAVRFAPAVFEELIEAERLTGWRDLVGLGREAKGLLTQAHGAEHVRDQVLGLLLAEPLTQSVGDTLASDALAATALNRDELLEGVLGGLLVEMRKLLPDQIDLETAKAVLSQGPSRHLKVLQKRLVSTVDLGVSHQGERMERSLKVARELRTKMNVS